MEKGIKKAHDFNRGSKLLKIHLNHFNGFKSGDNKPLKRLKFTFIFNPP